jgi:hypothetical protein
MLRGQCKMEVIFRPSIPDNLEHWQVNDDAEILRFLHSMQEFSDGQINFLAESMNLEVEDLPNNYLPKGVMPLERMFDRHDMYKGKPIVDQSDEAIEFNIGSENSPRMIKIGKGTTPAEIKSIMNLIREYKDIFAWSYEDLKAYKGDIIQHAIPLKERVKPFRLKQRNNNPKLAPLIQKELQKMVDAKIIAPIRYSS